jgi:glycosyltransferase involved in cell wall biosynthesis
MENQSMERRRILITGPAPPPPGGIASVIRTIVDGDLSPGWDFREFDIALRRGPRFPGSRWVNSLLSRTLARDGLYNLEGLAKIAAFRRALEANPALLHLHASHGYDIWLSVRMAKIARRLGIPSLLHLHGLFDVKVPAMPPRQQRAFWQALLVPDRLVVLSESWRRWFRQGVPSERIAVLRNPVDVSRFGPRHEREDETLRLLFVGLSEPVRKGAYEILEAAPAILARVPHARFIFAGQDVDRVEERVVRGSAIEAQVRFVGSQDAHGMVSLFEQADMLLLPSHSEGLPIALLEAMAASLPVVACPVNGIPEAMSDPSNGRFVPVRDAGALASAVIELAADPALRRRIGAANRKLVEREFDGSAYALALGNLYESMLSKRP